MHEDDVKTIVAAVLAEQKRLHNNEVDEVVLRTISTILTSFGIEEDDRIEMRADFIHLRKWRKASDQAGGFAFKAFITVVVSGLLGAFWVGFKALLGK